MYARNCMVILILHCTIVWFSKITPCNGQVVCENPGNPANGHSNVMVESDSTMAVGTVIEYSCSIGYEMVGSTELVCQPSGEWNGPVPTCQPVCQSVADCGYPVASFGMSVSLTDDAVGCEAVYTCGHGYELVGNATRACQPNGTWSGAEPSCKGIDCGKPSEIDDGMIIYVGTTFPSLVAYECNDGFELVGSIFHLCGMSGSWVGEAPLCQPMHVDCGDPRIPANGYASYENTTLNSTVTYSCNSSYVLCGDDTRTCLPNGTWSGAMPSCISPVVTMESTTLTILESERFVNITVLLDQPSCDNVTIVAVPTSVNASESDFDDTPITLNIPPGESSAIVSVRITPNIRVEDDESFDVILHSNSSGVTIGSPSQCIVTIIDDDAITVSFKRPKYIAKQKNRIDVCVTKTGKHDFPITILINEQNVTEGFTPSNRSLTFKTKETELCYKQRVNVDESIASLYFEIAPSEIVKIGNHGSTQIVIRCEVPDEPINGSAFYQSTDFGMFVTYSCDDGLELNGNESRECLDEGVWSGSVPVCRSVNCTVDGQMYLPCDGSCDLTCADDPLEDKICPLCVPECRCPSGTVLDEVANRCVKAEECSEVSS